jgi:hypothetical protein
MTNLPPLTHPAAGRRPTIHRATATIATERGAGYHTGAHAGGPAGAAAGPVEPDGAAASGPVEPPAPFGVRVLAEMPAFAAALEALVSADARMLEGVLALARLVDTDQVEHATGLAMEEWLGILARQTRMDRRLLLRLCRLLNRFPALAEGVEAGRVSFAQLRGVGLALKGAPTVIDDELNLLLVRLLDELAGADPDVLADQVRTAIDELAPRPVYDQAPEINRLWLQPNLEANGGRFGGELNTLGLAVLDTTTAPTPEQYRQAGSIEVARADNLLHRLTHTCPDPVDPSDDDGEPDGGGAATDDGRDGRIRTGAAGDDDAAATGGASWPPDDGAVGDEDRRAAADGVDGDAFGERVLGDRLGATMRTRLTAPKLLLRAELAALLDGEQLPVEVLTRLVGGKLKLSSDAAERLLDARGAELRTIVVDQGKVVGVGRTTRQPPGFLRDIALAVHDTCSGPLCQRPALGADLDHARPWWPQQPDEPYGTTDAFNLGPLCLKTNRTRQRTGWQAVQHPDGRRTWTHRRTGLTITSVPATWRPAGWYPPHRHVDPDDPGVPPTGAHPPDNSPATGTGPPDSTGPPSDTRPPDGAGPPSDAGPPPPLPPITDDLPF